MTVDGPGVVVEAVKLADDGRPMRSSGLYEARGGRAGATVRVGFPVAGVDVVDLLERPMSAAGTDPDGGVRLELRPFQIITLRLRRYVPGPTAVPKPSPTGSV